MKLSIKILSLTISIVVILLTWSKLFSQSEATNHPKESDKVLNNPYMGWAPNAEYTDYHQEHSLVYANIYWSEIESEKGNYNFDYIEEKYNFDYWKSKNVKIIIRLMMDYPNPDNNKQIPNWLYNEINGDGTWYNIEYGKGFSPNYSNETLIKYHNELIKSLGEKYNNSEEIAFIALGSLGHWGEWHTYQEEDLSIPFPSEEIANEYVNHYINHFDNKFLLMRRPFNIAKENNLGLFNDMLGHDESTEEFKSWINNGYHNYLFNSGQPAMKDFFTKAPSGGEFASGNSGLNYLTDSTIESTLKQIKDTHISFIGPNCPANQDNTNKEIYDRVLKTLGYRYVIQEVKHTDLVRNNIKIDILLENKGVAPFYYNWPVKVVVLDKDNNIVQEESIDTDIRTWLPGKININTKFKINKKLDSGKYTLALGIIDPSTNKASIKFANEEEIIPYYYKIGSFIK